MRCFWFLGLLAFTMLLTSCQDPALALEGLRVAIPATRGESSSVAPVDASLATALASASDASYTPAPETPLLPSDEGPHVLAVQSPLYQQLTAVESGHALPEGFAYAEEMIPNVLLEPRYSSDENFIGIPLPGYAAPRVVVSKALGEALARVQETLQPMGLGLKIFDAYRPLQAEEEMARWAGDASATGREEYYPRLQRWQILDQGYVAVGTGHTRGAAVDLTLIDLECGCELEMGGSFDLFDSRSHTASEEVDALAYENRQLLKTVMEAHGFRNFAGEWWHYNLINEPFPSQSFRFVIE